jgi:hypothetical protein
VEDLIFEYDITIDLRKPIEEMAYGQILDEIHLVGDDWQEMSLGYFDDFEQVFYRVVGAARV